MQAIRRLAKSPQHRAKPWLFARWLFALGLLCASVVWFQAVSVSHNHALADASHIQTCDICLLSQNTIGAVTELPQLALADFPPTVSSIRVEENPFTSLYSHHRPRGPPV
jgi:hypothetical protein